ncbi:MAG: C40 family peptidase [Lachnospiraceae bacterium]|nr:C40 family peptidase [Lachnospiraceae bacterium]
MKKLLKTTTVLSLSVMLLGSSLSEAFTFDTLDSRTAVAGASVALSRYLAENKDAADKLKNLLPSSEVKVMAPGKNTADQAAAEVLFDKEKTGRVHVDYSLRIREQPTTMADVVAVTPDQFELDIIGERTTGGKKWYKVNVYGETGYALADYIELKEEKPVTTVRGADRISAVSGGREVQTAEAAAPSVSKTAAAETSAETESRTEAEAAVSASEPGTTAAPETTAAPTESETAAPETSAEETQAAYEPVLPSAFAIPARDLAAVSADIAERLEFYAGEIRFCLGDHYTALENENNILQMFSTVVYVCDTLQNIIDIASEKGLDATHAEAVYALNVVNSTRASLSEKSGQSENDLFAQLHAEAQAKVDEENARIAREAEEAEAARQKAEADWLAREEEAERQRKAAEEAEAARLKAEEDRKAADEEAKRQQQEQADQEAAQKAEEEALKKAEEEAAAKAEAERLQQEAAEAERQAAEAKAAEQAAQDQAQSAASQAELAALCANQSAVPPRKEGIAYNPTGLAIVAAAEPYVGVLPYVWGGASLTSGCDCSGFAANIYAQFGIVSQAWAANHGNYFSGSMRNLGRAVSVNEMQPGDLICYEGHVALFWGVDAVGNARVIHEPMAGRRAEIGYVNYDRIITIRRVY